MNTKRREIILINQINNTSNISSNSIQHNDSECFVLSPVSLFAKVDWTRFEEDVEVINKIYSMLFDEFVIARNKLLCFWPSVHLADNSIIKLGEYCRGARIELDIDDTLPHFVNEDKMLPEFEKIWKSLILFIVESVCEDVSLNESIEEIATLKRGNESILVFSIRDNEMISYSYVKSQVTLFELQVEIDLYESKKLEQVIHFFSINELLILFDKKLIL